MNTLTPVSKKPGAVHPPAPQAPYCGPISVQRMGGGSLLRVIIEPQEMRAEYGIEGNPRDLNKIIPEVIERWAPSMRDEEMQSVLALLEQRGLVTGVPKRVTLTKGRGGHTIIDGGVAHFAVIKATEFAKQFLTFVRLQP